MSYNVVSKKSRFHKQIFELVIERKLHAYNITMLMAANNSITTVQSTLARGRTAISSRWRMHSSVALGTGQVNSPAICTLQWASTSVPFKIDPSCGGTWTLTSQSPKRHFDWFSRFCTVHWCAEGKQRHRDNARYAWHL